MLNKIGFYIVAKFVPLLVVMLSTYFFSRWLTHSQYGQYSLVISIASGLSIIAFQWINVTLGRLIPKSSIDVKIKIINSSLILYFISSILVLFLCFIFREFIEDYFKANSYLIALLAVALGGFELSQRIFNSEERVLAFGICQGIRGVVFFSFVLCFHYTDSIYPGVVYALIASYFLLSTPNVYKLLSLRKKDFLPNSIKEIAVFGFPLILTYVLLYVLNSSSKILLTIKP